jgi:hypothetical protein
VHPRSRRAGARKKKSPTPTFGQTIRSNALLPNKALRPGILKAEVRNIILKKLAASALRL